MCFDCIVSCAVRCRGSWVSSKFESAFGPHIFFWVHRFSGNPVNGTRHPLYVVPPVPSVPRRPLSAHSLAGMRVAHSSSATTGSPSRSSMSSSDPFVLPTTAPRPRAAGPTRARPYSAAAAASGRAFRSRSPVGAMRDRPASATLVSAAACPPQAFAETARSSIAEDVWDDDHPADEHSGGRAALRNMARTLWVGFLGMTFPNPMLLVLLALWYPYPAAGSSRPPTASSRAHATEGADGALRANMGVTDAPRALSPHSLTAVHSRFRRPRTACPRAASAASCGGLGAEASQYAATSRATAHSRSGEGEATGRPASVASFGAGRSSLCSPSASSTGRRSSGVYEEGTRGPGFRSHVIDLEVATRLCVLNARRP